MYFKVFFFSLNGYSEFCTLMAIDDTNIGEMEQFMRDELLDFFHGKCRNYNVEFNDTDLAYFCGLFEFNTKNFKFLSGEKKLIYVLSYYSKEVYEAKKIFEMPNNYKISREDTHMFPFGLYFGKGNSRVKHISAGGNELVNSVEPPKKEKMKESVCIKVNKMFESFRIVDPKVFCSDLIKTINSGSAIHASVSCAFRIMESKTKKVIVQAETRKDSTNIYWNCGNLKKHMKKMHMPQIDGIKEVNSPVGHNKTSTTIGTAAATTKEATLMTTLLKSNNNIDIKVEKM